MSAGDKTPSGGEQNHRDGTGGSTAAIDALCARDACNDAAVRGDVSWRHILDEEVAEAFAETNTATLREELIQIAAVAVAWVEAIDRRSIRDDQESRPHAEG